MKETKKPLCSRCKQALDWEDEEMIKNFDYQTLLNYVWILRKELKKINESKEDFK